MEYLIASPFLIALLIMALRIHLETVREKKELKN